MKNKFSLLILIPSLLISQNLYANGVAMTLGEVYVAKKVWDHKKLVLGTALLLGVGGFAGYKITKEKFIEMLEHPEDHEDMMLTLIEEHPLKFKAFKTFLNYNIENTDDLEYKQKILDFEDFYHIGKDDKIAYKIENSPEYNKYLNDIKERINKIEKEYEADQSKYKCDTAYYQKISYSQVDFPKELKLSIDSNIYAVNRYGNFPKVSGYTPDHIPSYKAIHNFIVLHGVILNPKREYNVDLDENLTAITIFTSEHQKGSRTYGGRNIKRSIEDSRNLKWATAKDIAFFSAYLILFKFRDPTDYIKANETLIKRNFYLCLY